MKKPVATCCGGYTKYHIATFFLTYVSYCFYNAARKTFSNVKTSVRLSWAPPDENETLPEGYSDHVIADNIDPFLENADEAEVFFGILDTVFLVSYAIGLYVSGMLGDRLDLRKVLGGGMCLSAFAIFMFGSLSEWISLYNKAYYIVFWILNGLLQGTGWPALIAIMGNWFTESRGLVFGLWTSCQSVGNILGSILAALVVNQGYEFAFLTTASILFVGGIIMLLFVVPSPSELNLPGSFMGLGETDETELKKDFLSTGSDATDEDDDDDDVRSTASVQRPQAIGFCHALILPGVALFALCYACLKLVNYAFFFWLPYYLSNTFLWTEVVSDQMSMFYDIGGIIGGVFGGLISDRIGVRSPVVVGMLVFSYGILFGYSFCPNSYILNAVLLTLVGIFVNGVAHVISSVVAADLGQQDAIRGCREALATVTGIIDGTGTMGAAVGQIIVPVLQMNYGWPSVFYFLAIISIIGTFFILPVFVKELKKLHNRSKYHEK
ncbi:sugar phosphate exchanger 3-like [Patiria miniata]|uniref:Sugar phosphate exchanger 3 n=1 Tax=Patiria miniata TaxID=46514 RepID=A0A914AFF8_PATMI|nr:sugar phosphate exchanger 3-like [Patiria miniata]